MRTGGRRPPRLPLRGPCFACLDRCGCSACRGNIEPGGSLAIAGICDGACQRPPTGLRPVRGCTYARGGVVWETGGKRGTGLGKAWNCKVLRSNGGGMRALGTTTPYPPRPHRGRPAACSRGIGALDVSIAPSCSRLGARAQACAQARPRRGPRAWYVRRAPRASRHAVGHARGIWGTTAPCGVLISGRAGA